MGNEGLAKVATKPLCEALEDDLRIRNRLSTAHLGATLLEVVSSLQQLTLYIETLDRIAKNYIIGNFGIENKEMKYTVTVGSSRMIAGYVVKAHIMDLRRIVELNLLFLKVKEVEEASLCRDLDRVRDELKNSISENINLLKENVMEVHYTLVEFVQKLVVHYEEQLFSNSPS